ncbi:hypothetical protein NEUTE2DRAFT_48575 [Neurospora tetrasperma FGSC 2509]|nr:hypothetical protein NEUTE2DRAFT_48575 [Neurospora tetrasperma FGSC 2509]
MFAGDSGGAIWSENTYCLGGRSADEVDNASSTGCPAKKMSAPHVRSRGYWYAVADTDSRAEGIQKQMEPERE